MNSENKEIGSGDFDELKALMEDYSPDFKVRLLKYIAQNNIGSCSTEIYSKIKPLFQNEFKSVRAEAFKTVGLIFFRSGEEEVLQELKKHLESEKQGSVIISLIEGFGKILEGTKNEKYYDFLKKFLFHDNEKVRRTTANVIASIFIGANKQEIITDLLKALSLSKAGDQEYIDAIEKVIGGKVTEKNLICFLRDCLDDKDYQIAIGATRILAIIFKSKTFIDEKIVSKLMNLAETKPQTRPTIASAFGQIYAQSKNMRIISFLKTLLKSEKNKDARKIIFSAIREIIKDNDIE